MNAEVFYAVISRTKHLRAICDFDIESFFYPLMNRGWSE